MRCFHTISRATQAHPVVYIWHTWNQHTTHRYMRQSSHRRVLKRSVYSAPACTAQLTRRVLAPFSLLGVCLHRCCAFAHYAAALSRAWFTSAPREGRVSTSRAARGGAARHPPFAALVLPTNQLERNTARPRLRPRTRPKPCINCCARGRAPSERRALEGWTPQRPWAAPPMARS